MDMLVVPGNPLKEIGGDKPGESHDGKSKNLDINSVKIEKIIKKALLQLPVLTTISVVEAATGKCLAHRSRTRNFDPDSVANCHAEMVRQKQQAMAALHMRGERLEDILISFRKQFHLLRLARNGQWFVFLAVKAQDTSLALAREILKSIIA